MPAISRIGLGGLIVLTGLALASSASARLKLHLRGSQPTPVAPAAAAPAVPAPAPASAPSAAPATAAKPGDNWTPEEIAAAKADCNKLLKDLPVEVKFLPPIRHGQCGTPQPVELTAFGSHPRVTVDPPATLNCAMAAKLTQFFATTVQPLAATWLKSRVVSIRNAASYDCRNRYGDPKQKLSEHAKANAIDIMAFVTASGKTVAVGEHWGPTLRAMLSEPVVAASTLKLTTSGFVTSVTVAAPADAPAETASTAPLAAPIPDPAALAAKSHRGSAAIRDARLAEATRRGIVLPKPSTPEGTFVHAVHDTACNVFGTVLGPEANDAHKDHFHVDLASRSGSSYCE